MKSKFIIILAVLIVFVGCSITKEVVLPAKEISKDKFLKVPFGHDESIASFTKSLPNKTTIRKLVRRNTHNPEKTDTIYQFRYKNSEIFVFKSHYNSEMLMAGTIADNQVKLVNGITTGITREQLYKAINGLKQTEADTVKMSTPDNTRNFSFIFKKGKLKKISFASYYD